MGVFRPLLREDAVITTCSFEAQQDQPPITGQVFPRDAHAFIYKPARSPMTAGKARTHDWKLRFERRTAPLIEPLMGWTEGDDTLAQVELSFPSAEAAVAYAVRHGLSYSLYTATREPSAPAVRQDAAAAAREQRMEWVERRLGPDVIRDGLGIGTSPSELYTNPDDILADPNLSWDRKHELLQRWALDAYQLDLAFSRGTYPGTSRLQEVIDALTALDHSAPANGTQAA